MCLVLAQLIGNHIKDNIDDNLNGMIWILGKHGNCNRIEFGSALSNINNLFNIIMLHIVDINLLHICLIWKAIDEQLILSSI